MTNATLRGKPDTRNPRRWSLRYKKSAFASIVFSVCAFALFAEAEKPLWTAGIVTDTHLRSPKTGYERFESAVKFFREKKVDAFFHCGDIAENYDPKAYAFMREVMDREFAPNHIRDFFVYHNHDRMGPRKSEDPFAVFTDVRHHLKANDLYVSTVFRDTPVILLPYRWIDHPEKGEALISEAERRFPNGPVIVFDHTPPPNTVANSGVWGGSPRMRPFYRQHPRVILLTGHTHSSVQSETEIYQDADLTVVNAGCLSWWTGETVGYNPPHVQGTGVLLMEVFPTRVVFRRFDLRDGREFHPERPWTFHADHWKRRDYDRAKLKATSPKAEFPKGASLALAPAANADFNLTIPTASMLAPGDAYLYKIEILDGSGRVVARRDEQGVYHTLETARPQTIVHQLPYALVRGIAGATVRVTPLNFYSVPGTPLTRALTAEERQLADSSPILWTGTGPFEIQPGNYHLLPPEATAATKCKERVRFALDLETEQEAACNLSIDMRVAGAHRQLRPWLLMTLAPGKPGVLRYVFDVITDRDANPFEVFVHGLNAHRAFRIHRITVSR